MCYCINCDGLIGVFYCQLYKRLHPTWKFHASSTRPGSFGVSLIMPVNHDQSFIVRDTIRRQTSYSSLVTVTQTNADLLTHGSTSTYFSDIWMNIYIFSHDNTVLNILVKFSILSDFSELTPDRSNTSSLWYTDYLHFKDSLIGPYKILMRLGQVICMLYKCLMTKVSVVNFPSEECYWALVRMIQHCLR